jgi:hypothetical protein
MRVTPKTDEQIAAEQAERAAQFKPWPTGSIVDYEILHAEDTETKGKRNEYGDFIEGSKKPMIKADVRLFNAEGKTKDITDFIGEWNEYKLKRIVPDRYEAGQVDAFDLIGKTGKCKIGIQIGGLKDDGTRYADKNDIKEYLKRDEPIQKKTVAIEDELSDLIPF